MIVAGIDEVGRGALAGPALVGAAVVPWDERVFREKFSSALGFVPRDSKQLTRLQREKAALWLQEAVVYACGTASVQEINEIGIVPALRLAAGRALDGLSLRPERVLADAGLFHPYEATLPTQRFVKGDETIPAILCASIIAKVTRDAVMQELAAQYPVYGWEQNVGYGTAVHRNALQTHNLSDQHRHLFCRSILAQA